MAEAPVNPDDGKATTVRQSPVEAFKRGEIDIFTLVLLVPETSIPPQYLARYVAAKEAIEHSTPHRTTVAEKKLAAERTLNSLERLLLTHGQAYVNSYIELKHTDRAINAGASVFQSQWFKDLQESRRQQIEELETRLKSGNLTKDQADRLRELKIFHAGDSDAHQQFRELADRIARISERALAGQLTEKEIQDERKAAKESAFSQLDKMSPQVRAAVLLEMQQHDPALVKEYEARARSAPAPETNAPEKSAANGVPDAASLPPSGDDYIVDVIKSPPTSEVSAAKKYGFPTFNPAVSLSETFGSIACNTLDSAKPNPTSEEKPSLSRGWGASSPT